MGGTVSYLTAPDIEHHIFLSDWAAAYPGAHIIAPEGLAEKRANDTSIAHVSFNTIFTAKDKSTQKISEEFDKDFDYEFVDAHPNKELVFHYKPEKTLIEADLLFNLPATEQYSRTGEPANKGILTKFFATIQSTTGSAIWQKRMQWYLMSSKDRSGFDSSVQRIAQWDFQKIIPCHGDVIEDGQGIFKKVFEWHLQGKSH
jgi:hypothetical protein